MSQQSKTTLQSAINTQLADNTSGDISAADIRDNLINITDSLLFNTGSGQSLTGSLDVTGGITIVSGSLTITGSINNTGSVFLGKLDQFGFNRNLSISFNNENETAILAAGATRANRVQFVSSTGTSTLSAGSICEIISPVVNIIAPTTNITGSAIISGSLIVTGSITPTGGFTGSLLGTASWATNATTAGTAGLVTFYPDPSDINYAILFTDQTDPFNPGVSAPLYDSSVNVFTYNPSANRLSLTGSLTVSSAGQVVIITGLPTSEPATSGQLWLSGSAGNSKFLCVRN